MTLSTAALALYAGRTVRPVPHPRPGVAGADGAGAVGWVRCRLAAGAGGRRSAISLWPLAAIFGLSWLSSVYGGFMEVLRWAAVAIFIVLGVRLIVQAARPVEGDRRLTRPGRWAGFAAGVTVILSNPKAILFYMGVLPGFFDLRHVGPGDIAAILVLSVLVPLIGNLGFAWIVDRVAAPAGGPVRPCPRQPRGGRTADPRRLADRRHLTP